MTVMVTVALALAVLLLAAAVVVCGWFVGRMRVAVATMRQQSERLTAMVDEIVDEAAVTQLESEAVQRSIADLGRRRRH